MKKTNQLPIKNQPLTKLELKRISALEKTDIKFIDDTLLSCISLKYSKQALIIIIARQKMEDTLGSIPLTYYSMRIQKMVEEDILEANGNLEYLRFSEVRKKSY
tara:strand:+ start:4777 stop:5088 length:312 start_codon:yes stop_codon:yes gene_type:complete